MVAPGKQALGFGSCEVTPGKYRYHSMTALLNVCAAAFFPINQREDKCDVTAGSLDRVYCLEG